MNSIERRYAEFDSDWMMLSKTTKGELVKMTVLYLMRAVTSQEYSELVRDRAKWSGAQMSEFRTNLKDSGYIQRDLKFYIYEAVVDGTFTWSSRIHKEDRVLVQRLIRGEDEYCKALIKQCRAFRKLNYVPRNILVFNKKCEALVEDLDLYCKKFVLKKLRFVVQQNAMRIQDMVNELMCDGIYAIYRAYPEILDGQHMLNIAKQAVHNRGENIIQEATTQSRSRLIKNSDGTFSARLVAIDSNQLGQDMTLSATAGPISSGMMVCTSLMADLEGNCAKDESAANVDAKRDLRQKVDQLLADVKSPKARKFIELLMGVHDQEFSAKLGQENDELCDSLPRHDYAELVRQHLGVSVSKARSFVRGLRSELSPYRN
jgi:hypothetical protein